jgi:tetratricopeptide (TPR) repeat protein
MSHAPPQTDGWEESVAPAGAGLLGYLPPSARADADAARALADGGSGLADGQDSWGASRAAAGDDLPRDLFRAAPPTAAPGAGDTAPLPEVGADFVGFRLLSDLGRDDEARRLRARADGTPVRDAWDSFLLARDRAVQGRLSEAAGLLREVVAADPGNFAALFLMGNCRLDDYSDRPGHEADAVASYSACIALRPDFAGGWFNRGLAYLRKRDYDEAEADFTRAAKLRPRWTEAYVHRALAREGQRRYPEALEDLDRAVELGAPSTRVYYMRAALRSSLGDRGGALRDLAEATGREPVDEESGIARGVARLTEEDADGALADFTEAVKLNPRSVAGWQDQAHVLSERLKRTKDALARLDKVLELRPDFVPALAGRAVVRARLGDRAGARADAGRAVELDPDNGGTLFQAACARGLIAEDRDADCQEAFRLLGRALERGYGWDRLGPDGDLAPLQTDPLFKDFVKAGRALRAAAGQ